jgi:CBS domain-containing protein/uncharacterized protein (DUF2267 family)
MSLDRYRRPRLVVLKPHATAYEASRAMAENHVDAILVGDARDVIGILTDRDLVLEVIANEMNAHTTTLREIMSSPLMTIDIGASLVDAAQKMHANACRRLPITEDGIPVGIVTLDDLLHDAEVPPGESRAALIAQIDSMLPPASEPFEKSDRRTRARVRRRARAESTFQRLLRAVERNSGITDRVRAEKAVGIVLGAVCRRLTPQEARHLVAQLPSKLHAELVACLDGPDKRITTQSIEQELQREIGLDQGRATDVLYGICDAVADGISAGEIDAVRGQLPSGMKELFPETPYRRVS